MVAIGLAYALGAVLAWPIALSTPHSRPLLPVTGSATPATHKVSLNTATIPELRTLPAVGELLAQRIVAGRPYSELRELLRIKGMNRRRYQEIVSRVVL